MFLRFYENPKKERAYRMKNQERKKSSSGVSLIALVITIIVVIILAVIAFGSSTRTITKANYSTYVNNVGEVYTAFHTRATTIKGQEAAKGNTVTDAQVYNYLARDGQTSEDFLVRANLPDYTVIQDGGQIGMDLPKMKVESGLGKMVEVKYAVTKEGEIFTWPPFEVDEEETNSTKMYINSKDTVTSKVATNITVGGMEFEIQLKEDKTLKSNAAFTTTVEVASLRSGDLVTGKIGETPQEFYVLSVNGSEVKLITKNRVGKDLLQGSTDVQFDPNYTSGNGYWYDAAIAAESDASKRYPYDLISQKIKDEDSGDRTALWVAQNYGKQFSGVKDSNLMTKKELDILLVGVENAKATSYEGTSYQSIIQGIKVPGRTTETWLQRNYNWWLGSAFDASRVLCIESRGIVRYGNPRFAGVGVRPVLTISRSNIEKVES